VTIEETIKRRDSAQRAMTECSVLSIHPACTVQERATLQAATAAWGLVVLFCEFILEIKK